MFIDSRVPEASFPRFLSIVIAGLVCVGCSSVPDYKGPTVSTQTATIEKTGVGMMGCGLSSNPICEAKVLLIDGEKTGFFSSGVNIAPGQHTLRLMCFVKTGAFANPKFFASDQTVNISPGGKYIVKGTMEDGACKLSLVDQGTNAVVTPTVTVVKASAPGTYPESQTIKLFPSTDTVSTWTETPAEYHLIPDSQVFVTGRGGNAGNVGGLFGGALGAVIGVQMDRSGNAETIAKIEQALSLKFTQQLSAALKATAATRTNPHSYVEVAAENEAQLSLLPSATLTLKPDGQTMLSFRLTVRIHQAQGTKEATRNFFYLVGKTRPLEGTESWTEGQSKAIRSAASVALANMSSALIDDIEGKSTIDDPSQSRFDRVWRQH